MAWLRLLSLFKLELDLLAFLLDLGDLALLFVTRALLLVDLRLEERVLLLPDAELLLQLEELGPVLLGV